jgi:hypothetical protein
MSNNFEKLEHFTSSIATSRILLQRAHKQEFLIEALVLYAALIDGFCRIALMLKQQIKNNTQDFNEEYIFQDENKRNYFSERSIYKLCLENFILDKDLFDEIESLYDIRNKVIHRFLITEIEYSHLGLVLDKYELIYQRLWNIVYGLESEQISKGVGMTISAKVDSGNKKEVFVSIINKIDSKDVKKLMKTLGNKLIKNGNEFSEENERNIISDEINDEIEIRNEKDKIPTGYTSVKEVTKWAERKKMFEKCLCGHEKIYHININQRPPGNNIENYAKDCNIKGCNCKSYGN